MRRNDAYALAGILGILGLSFVLATQPTILGAVTGKALAINIFSVMGAFFLLLALTVLVTSKRAQEKTYKTLGLDDLVEELGTETSAVIVDSSAIVAMEIDQKGKAIDFWEAYNKEKLFVPKTVENELKRGRLKNKEVVGYLHKNGRRVRDSLLKGYQDVAQKYLNLTDKAQIYFGLGKLIELEGKTNWGKNKVAVRELTKYKRKNQESLIKWKNEKRKIQNNLRRKNMAASDDIVLQVLKDNYKPSSADRDVLAYALLKAAECEKDEYVEIFARDSDFSSALDIIRKGYDGINPVTGNNIKIKPHKKKARKIIYIEPGEYR